MHKKSLEEIKKEIKELIVYSVDKALNKLLELLNSNSPFFDEVIIQKSQLIDVSKKRRNGTILLQEELLNTSKVRVSVMDIISEISEKDIENKNSFVKLSNVRTESEKLQEYKNEVKKLSQMGLEITLFYSLEQLVGSIETFLLLNIIQLHWVRANLNIDPRMEEVEKMQLNNRAFKIIDNYFTLRKETIEKINAHRNTISNMSFDIDKMNEFQDCTLKFTGVFDRFQELIFEEEERNRNFKEADFPDINEIHDLIFHYSNSLETLKPKIVNYIQQLELIDKGL